MRGRLIACGLGGRALMLAGVTADVPARWPIFFLINNFGVTNAQAKA